MKIQSVRHIDGPNVYIYKPVMIARIDLEELTERESNELTGFSDRLLRVFPGLKEHHCAKGEPGGFVERLYGGTYFGHIVEHVAIELACCSGLDVHYGKTLYAGRPGLYDSVMECKEFACQSYLLYSAVEIVEAIAYQHPFDVDKVFAEAKGILARTQLGPSTTAIVRAALKRQIPVRRLNGESIVQLGYGRHRKLVEATITQNTSAVAVDIASDKESAKRIMENAGIPVPIGGVAESVDEAVDLFHSLGQPVVIKPYNGNQGKGVSLNLQTDHEVEEGYRIAQKYASKVIVERYLEGRNIRLIVVGGKYVAASERIPAHVLGDGRHTIQELIDKANQSPMRGDGHEKPLTKLRLDDVVLHTLRRQKVRPDSVPTLGQVIFLRTSANLSTGGEAIDITNKLHGSYVSVAERTARILGLDVCGIDMVVAAIDAHFDRHRCSVIEVNAAPGIRMHEHPSLGTPRRVGEAIVESLYPNGSSGRIPIVSITGTNGKTTTTRLIGHALSQTGKKVGMTTTGGVWVNDEQIMEGDTTGPASARVVLSDPGVDIAVLETARGGIARGGLAYDKANVAVLTNISGDHIGQDNIESVDDLVHIKSLVAECVWDDGTVVLNADDPQLVQLSERITAQIYYFSTSNLNPAVQRHLACGGVAYYQEDGWLMESRGNLTFEILPVHEIPLTMRGTAKFQIENCLAATAALRALGISRLQIARALSSFLPSRQNPGRMMFYKMQSGGHVILDYGHNSDGFSKFGAWLRTIRQHRLIGIVGVPGDRSNPVIQESAHSLAGIFDEFVIKEDADKRGREHGEVAVIMATEIRLAEPTKPQTIIEDEQQALAYGVTKLGENDIAVMFYESFQQAEEWTMELGGERMEGLPSLGHMTSSAAAL